MAGFDCLNHVYKAIVRPVLEYGAVVWDTPFKKYQLMLERVQNFAGMQDSDRELQAMRLWGIWDGPL